MNKLWLVLLILTLPARASDLIAGISNLKTQTDQLSTDRNAANEIDTLRQGAGGLRTCATARIRTAGNLVAGHC